MRRFHLNGTTQHPATRLGFRHRKVQPLWPRANGEAERFMPSLEKCARTAIVKGKNWKQELYKFLKQYRATPHMTTNLSPSEALNGRKLKITLPEVSPTPARKHTLQETRKTMAERDAEQNSRIKAYSDSKLGTKPNNIKQGDTVLVRQTKKNKLSTPFNPEPLVVEEKKGSMVTASDGFKSTTRNSSIFKIVPKDLKSGQRTSLLNKPKFRHKMAIQIHQAQITEACRGYRDRGDPQRGSQITFK